MRAVRMDTKKGERRQIVDDKKPITAKEIEDELDPAEKDLYRKAIEMNAPTATLIFEKYARSRILSEKRRKTLEKLKRMAKSAEMSREFGDPIASVKSETIIEIVRQDITEE